MDFEKILILLIFGLIGLFRWLFMDGGLKRLLGKFESDLSGQDEALKRSTMTNMRRQTPTPRPITANPEEERVRKFMEALGLPADAAPQTPPARRPAQYPVPPIIAQPPRLDRKIAERARRERQRIQHLKAEQQRAAEKARTPPPLETNEEDESVSRYFEMEKFDRPKMEMESIPAIGATPSLGTEDFFNPLAAKQATAAVKLTSLFGSPQDLRRLILMKEILGRPKSLQNS